MDFNSQDKNIRLIGQGGNTKVYLLSFIYNGFDSAIIKAPQGFVNMRVMDIFRNYNLLKQYGVKTTQFLEICTMDGNKAIITENLHQNDYTCLDANAHLRTEQVELLEKIELEYGIVHNDYKEPEEERNFASKKFKVITNLEGFVKEYLNELKNTSSNRIFLPYDSYFFKVKNAKITDIDYIIADWDGIEIYDKSDFFEINKEQFQIALLQFMMKYVEEEYGNEYEEIINKNVRIIRDKYE